uniref:Mucin-2-like n=1 Tax=Saccoglossus kowalevskii TaxID=10224 RepID=A0ABM0LYB5_SACKO|nr:PREDICTED: mucin-2-like [Saccoglossus kowalevskii]
MASGTRSQVGSQTTESQNTSKYFQNDGAKTDGSKEKESTESVTLTAVKLILTECLQNLEKDVRDISENYCGNHITDCTELVQNRNPSSPPSLCCFQSISSSMWAFILYITLSLCTSHVMSNKLGNQWVSSLSLRDENDGKTCHDGEGHAGVCRDDRIDDNSGCYTHSKICWAHNNCNRHLMCFIPYMPGDLDGPCRSSGFGAHCVAREEQCFGVIHKNLCPCDYGCCHPFVDLICPNPNVCQLASATCPGIFYDTDVCGVGNGCCYNSIDDSQCTSIPVLGGVSGTCQYDNTLCDGWYVSNECGGHPNRRCCKPKTPDADAPYTNYPGAQCLDMTKEPCPNGDYRSGLCDPAGPRERQCYPTTGAIEPSPCHLAGGCCRPLRCENKEIEINEHCFQNEATSGLPTCKCCRPIQNGGGNGYGDPHFETLDHKSFQFDGHCSYVLLRECKKPLHTPRFTIINKHGLMESLKGKLKAYVSKISVVIQLSSKNYFKAELLESKYVSIIVAQCTVLTFLSSVTAEI